MARELIRDCFEKALHVIHTLEARAPQLWTEETPTGLYGQEGVIHLVTEWLNGRSIPFSVLEGQRAIFAEAVEVVRYTEVGLDGKPLAYDPDQRHPECAIGGLVGSALLILITAISCIELPNDEVGGARPPGTSRALRERIHFAEQELQRALDCLVMLETLQRKPLVSFLESFRKLINCEERLSMI